MSDSLHTLAQLNRRCRGARGLCSTTGTPHRHATGTVARDAAIYHFLMCKAILVGLRRQLREDGHLTVGACGFTTWNKTLEKFSEAQVNRDARHILSVTAVDEHQAESDEESVKNDPSGMLWRDKSLTETSPRQPGRRSWSISWPGMCG